MSSAQFSMRQLLEAGVHYGHHTRRWNPKMAPYIFGVRNSIHIIDLEQTVPLLKSALAAIRNVVASGGRVLFVATKPQASDVVKEAAQRCGQYYINHRWLGGTLTNWKTVNQSIKRLRDMEEILQNPEGMTKKEILDLQRQHDRLELNLGGIREMGGVPDMIFIIDTNKEDIAIKEAKRLGVPVVAVLDSNSDPSEVDYPIPGNDDAIRSISLYCNLVADTVLQGLQAEMISAGIDIGSSANLKVEENLDQIEEEAGE